MCNTRNVETRVKNRITQHLKINAFDFKERVYIENLILACDIIIIITSLVALAVRSGENKEKVHCASKV